MAPEVTPTKKLLSVTMFSVVMSAQTTLAIHYYNRAAVPAKILDSAIQEASRILARAGVETAWTEYPPDAAEGCTFDFSGRSAIQRPKPDMRNYLVVSIGSAGSASAYRETFGFALPDASSGVHAFIFWDRVEQFTDPRLITQSRLLGNAMAHEIGHVLLGSVQHSPDGLMKARWDKTDYLRADAGMMRFNTAEAELIRTHPRSRIEPARSIAAARGGHTE